jgi:hypothetical protein
MICALINCLAKGPESSAKGRIVTGKARPGAQVGKIKNQIFNRIRLVFERSGNCESFASLEETENNSPPRWRSIAFDQSEPPPCVGRRADDLGGLIMLQLGATSTRERQSLVRWGIDQGDAMGIYHRRSFDFGEIDSGGNQLTSPNELGKHSAAAPLWHVFFD